ncbi:MAG: saccharopine dehydrogenase C-terminal domain-containing protein [Gemmatimonadales bacterium]|nr:saccharopine dehydrogenase C-terminal domain-containing protein [Gemmatimonadales bacterium]
MRYLVLGAGLQGCAAAFDLLRHPSTTVVTLADHREVPLPPFLARAADARLVRRTLDVTDRAAAIEAVRGHQAVLCALPYYFNEPMTAAAIAGGAHFCDLGGNTEIVMAQKRHHAAAEAAGVSVIPDCGLAPGMVNILAVEAMRRLGHAREVRIYVGGLPQQPEPPLNYQIVYSLEGALDYYTTPSWVLRHGHAVQVDALSEVVPVTFPAPLGTLEAFHTGGGISTLPFTWEGKVDVMEYKTLRYPGHAALMRDIRSLGLLGNEPIDVRGQAVRPRDAFIAAVSPLLRKPEGRDLVALRVEAAGERDGAPARVAFQCIARYDEALGVSAMMQTTGYSLAITALMQADGRVTARGVHTPDEAMPAGAYIAELGRRGVVIEEAA